MSDEFLYKKFNTFSELEEDNPIRKNEKEIKHEIIGNLNPKFPLRPYQNEAFSRFLYYFKSYSLAKKPTHLLFNMATGSGKTLIMAGLILYLYSKGYRNFLFFVNQDNIIKKTKDNFLNKNSSKYLFNETIIFNNQVIDIKEVKNFQGVSKSNINICFTTIQKLHGDIKNEKENSITIEDFKNENIVLLSDEAHHMQVNTRQAELLESNWENTVENIFNQSHNNLLLEFTATMDFSDNNIRTKYLDKILYHYDLKQFRNDGYSKDVDIFQSDSNEEERILQALILNQYRQAIAAKHHIDLKPVILFKAQRTIKESIENEKKFHRIIDNLDKNDIEKIRQNTNSEILTKALDFFEGKGDVYLIEVLKNNFAPSKCMNVNKDDDLKEYQLALNSLEDKDNQIRAIFAVQKLNEGWDVLNLFDIVRLYNTRDTRNNQPGTTTISEAQLIGRGARYFPFIQNESQERYKRKFDDDVDNELRIIEQLHYHSFKNLEYISELRQALIEQGILDPRIQLELKLKESFKKQDIYQKGFIYLNCRRENKNENVKSFDDLGIHFQNTRYSIPSGANKESKALSKENDVLPTEYTKEKAIISLKEIHSYSHVIQGALAKTDFFTFKNLKRYFPKLKSMKEFIESKDYMGKLSIDFEGQKSDMKPIQNIHYLDAVLKLLEVIETKAKANTAEYIGTIEFKPHLIKDIFEDKIIKRAKYEEDTEHSVLIERCDWYAFDGNHGTGEEKAFIEMMEYQISKFKTQGYKNIHVLRNEGHFKIYNFENGKGFQPDYVLFMNDKDKKILTYQFYMEPKGPQLQAQDAWKEEFLKSIEHEAKVIEFDGRRNYKLIGLPFYTQEIENLFIEALDKKVN